MGIYVRPDSPFHWMLLERRRQQPLRESTGVPTEGGSAEQNKELRRQAQEIYAARMTDLARARFKLPTDLARRSFQDQRAWYATHVSSKKGGKVKELSMLRQLGAFFDGYDLVQIDRELVREWKTWRVENVKPITVNREDEVLKHLLNCAVPKYLDTNPIAGMARLSVEDIETRILTWDEEDRLLRAATDPIERAAALCGMDGLMRRGSVAGLARAQDHRTSLTLLNGKAGTYRVPLSGRLRLALDALAVNLPPDAKWYFHALGPRIDIALSQLFTTVCARASVVTGREQGGVTFHSLRHTGASRLIEAKVDIKTVMRLGGWKNLKTLQRYLHPTDAAAQTAVDSFGSRESGA